MSFWRDCVLERGRALDASSHTEELSFSLLLSCLSPVFSWGDSYRTGVFCQLRAGAGLPGLSCLPKVRGSCPPAPTRAWDSLFSC